MSREILIIWPYVLTVPENNHAIDLSVFSPDIILQTALVYQNFHTKTFNFPRLKKAFQDILGQKKADVKEFAFVYCWNASSYTPETSTTEVSARGKHFLEIGNVILKVSRSYWSYLDKIKIEL